MALFNKFCGFDKIIINKNISKSQIDDVSKTLYNYYKDNKKYYDALTLLDIRLFFFISTTKHVPSLSIEEMGHLKDAVSSKMLKNLPKQNVMLGYSLAEAISTKCINNLNPESSLNKLFKSGSRFSKAQLVRSCIAINYSADAENMVISEPVGSSLLEGLTEEQYFRVSPGTRKSIADKAKSTPQSGYMERTLVMALAMVELDMDDCETETFLEPHVKNQSFASTLVGKYYRDPLKNENEWKVLDYKTAMTFIDRKIEIRSPMTCINPNFRICRKCFGEKKLATKYVGIVAGQSLVERLTQLTLRTFHESGRAILSTEKPIIDFFTNHLTDVVTIEDKTKLCFDTNEFPFELTSSTSKIPGLIETNYEQSYLIYTNDSFPIKNNDVIQTITDIKVLLKNGYIPQNKPPIEFYMSMMTSILEVGTVYSSFVEILFANMLLVDYEEHKFWRYNQHLKPTFKLGDKSMAAYISPLLGLLYQPNKISIDKIDLEDLDDLDDINKLTIYERIWLNKI